jgi:SAM-dependent methyltransferase
MDDAAISRPQGHSAMTSAAKLPFLRRMIRHRLSHRKAACPYCGESSRLQRIARKKLVLDVLQCEQCLLMFRWPVETREEFYTFYQGEYAEGAITDVPLPDELARLCLTEFRGGPLDLAGKIKIVRALVPAGRALDYGCSWGYGVHQLRQAGFDALGFEISARRAAFGRTGLGVEILENREALESLPEGSFDVLFSNHVVEHLPDLGAAFEQFRRLLRREGLLFLVLPNFDGERARHGSLIRWIGAAHPVAPTRKFFLRNLPTHAFADVRCGSGPFTETAVEQISQGRFDALPTEGDELLVIARKA